jgi:hypothetical protein
MSNVHLHIIGSELFCNLLTELNFNYSISSDKNFKYNKKDHLVRVIFIEKIQLAEIKDIVSWNRAVIFELPKYVKTSHAMFIHGDGYVINPELWNPDWLNLDFIGAPWPLPTDDYSYRTPDGEIVRVGNSVSLRSKEMLELPYQIELAWRSYFGNTNEDGFLTCHNRRLFQHQGARYAPIEVAKHFSREMEIPENQDVDKPFAFHMHDTMPGRNEQYRALMI